MCTHDRNRSQGHHVDQMITRPLLLRHKWHSLHTQATFNQPIYKRAPSSLLFLALSLISHCSCSSVSSIFQRHGDAGNNILVRQTLSLPARSSQAERRRSDGLHRRQRRRMEQPDQFRFLGSQIQLHPRRCSRYFPHSCFLYIYIYKTRILF